jgi:MazG family protein
MSSEKFETLLGLMKRLRAPGGCPWDREQTHATLRPFLLEETYEALEAMDRGDLDGLRGEIGDVLFQCVFHAQIASEARRWTMRDAIDAIADKLIRRHPHVFTPGGRPLAAGAGARRSIGSAGAVVEQWEQIKAREQRDAGQRTRLLAGVPRALPALLRAHEIGTRVAAVGFDWPRTDDVIDKIDEEVRELREAATQGRDRTEDEIGDLLFSIANLARKLGIEPESALRRANDKFSARFAGVEAALEEDGRTVHQATLDELESAWQRIKTAEASQSSRSGRRSSGRARAGRRSRR